MFIVKRLNVIGRSCIGALTCMTPSSLANNPLYKNQLTYVYNKSSIVTTTLKFTHSYLDSHGHKDCYCCYGKLKTEALVGYCKYYSTDPTSNIVCIEYIHVDVDQRRKGYATQFVEELQKNHILGWDYSFTPEGRKWYNALIDQKVVDSLIISEQLQYV